VPVRNGHLGAVALGHRARVGLGPAPVPSRRSTAVGVRAGVPAGRASRGSPLTAPAAARAGRGRS
jgi:hypothetical protein